MIRLERRCLGFQDLLSTWLNGSELVKSRDCYGGKGLRLCRHMVGFGLAETADKF